jgi:hypothetical protein
MELPSDVSKVKRPALLMERRCCEFNGEPGTAAFGEVCTSRRVPLVPR